MRPTTIGNTDHLPEAEQVCAAARKAHPALLGAPASRLRAYFKGVHERLHTESSRLLSVNGADLRRAEGSFSPALLDRGRLTAERVAAMAAEQLEMATAPEVVGRTVRSWTRPNGIRYREVRHPLGLIAAVFEARYNVLLDISGQALRSRNAVVLKGGRMLAGTDAALVDLVVHPSLAAAGLPPEVVGSMRRPERECVIAILDQRPEACIGRGGSQLIAMLGEECGRRGVELIAHDKGGGWLYIHSDAAPDTALAMVRNSLDRRGVCNRLNALLLHQDLGSEFCVALAETLRGIGVRMHATSACRDRFPWAGAIGVDELEHEWLSDDISVHQVGGWPEAVSLCNRLSTGIGLSVCTRSQSVARRMGKLFGGSFFGHNAITRFNDGFQIHGRPETGIVTRTTTGARGAVTYPDLTQRKILADGTGLEARN